MSGESGTGSMAAGATNTFHETKNGSGEAAALLCDVRALLASGHQQDRTALVAPLARLKALGRDPAAAGPLFEAEGVEALAACGLDNATPPDAAARQALRALANALVLAPPTRALLAARPGVGPALTNRLRGGAIEDAGRPSSSTIEDEFLAARLLFLLTYGGGLDFAGLLERHGLAAAVCARLEAHRESIENDSSPKAHEPSAAEEDSLRTMALTDLLKLLFNLTHFHPDATPRFDPAVPTVFALLAYEFPRARPCLEPPVAQLVNALLNLDLRQDAGVDVVTGTGESGEQLKRPATFTTANVELLLDILDASLTDYTPENLDTLAAPLVSLLRKIFPLSSVATQELMLRRLLPADVERERPLGVRDSHTTFARLIRLSSGAAATPSLRDPISGLLFELSGGDAAAFVRVVGLGHAAGFLANHGLAMPNLTSPQTSSDDRHITTRRAVNPVTGQYLDAEAPSSDDGPPMTAAEREREAERLFVLFERLRATGVVDVQNPVEAAARAGRFEDMSDGDDDDDGG